MLSETRQAQLYEQLERETEFFQKQAAVVKTVAKLLGPTVVHIEADVTERRSLQHGQGGQVEEAGSGVIIKHNGKYYVLTNRHVIRGAVPRRSASTWPTAAGSTDHASGQDAETDVAVMAIDAPDLVDARLGNSDAIEIGDFVLAVGSPFGLSHSVTFGIISAKGRRDLESGRHGRRLPELHPDRRRHQPRQQRRPADQPPRRGDRHQHGHRQQFRRQRGHRLRHPHQHVHERRPATHRQGPRRSGVSRA